MKRLTFSDHGKLGVAIFGLGVFMIVAWTRSMSREDIMLFMLMSAVEGFLIRSIVAK